MGKLVYKPSELADIFGVTVETVRNWIKRGWIPSQKIGKRFYIPAEAVDILLAMGKGRKGGKPWRI